MVLRFFVEKKVGFDVEAQALCADIKRNLGIQALLSVRIINRYDVDGLDESDFEIAKRTIFSEPQVDVLYSELPDFSEQRFFAIEQLPGQFDQRAESAAQCIQILTLKESITVKTARIVALSGNITQYEFSKIKEYCINPVESRVASLEPLESLEQEIIIPSDVTSINGFTDFTDTQLAEFLKEHDLAMDINDALFCRDYFSNTEKRDPTLTEIKLIDTYWSDHCRHTTFLTNLENIEIEDQAVRAAFNDYLASRKFVYEGRTEKPITLMDLATIATKDLKKRGKLTNLDESEEINACSIEIEVDIKGEGKVPYLVMFKNETHNHPTEIEPFGGAATCLGGAIRDPLSGRAYVYQAMRVTGSGDPTVPESKTLQGKLSQRKITTGAAAGYSSYGNQIGLATGHVSEIYHEGYIAKRMEIGAVIAATPKENVVRLAPVAGDYIVLLGGRTGRDGCGGATGSSRAHTDEAILTCGAEVQKGNAPEERKLQRLFRNSEVAKRIKRCNDFGAGGVSVAIGEIADGLIIDLDNIPKKYEGLDGTELAISESQERMAVCVSPCDLETLMIEADRENIERTVVAVVTEDPRLVMKWRGETIANISRTFLSTNGAKKASAAHIGSNHFSKQFNSDGALDITQTTGYVAQIDAAKTTKEKLHALLSDLNVCSQKGLVERFDASIGAGSVLMPCGGKHQLSPQQSMVAKIPLISGETTTATAMAYGFNPYISEKSPFHGGAYAVVESIAKLVATGACRNDVYLTFQEYFERLGSKESWGKPLSALLGAFHAQMQLETAAIGGKDSMSGSFMDLSVPPTLVSFAVAPIDSKFAISTEFKSAGNKLVLFKPSYNADGIPDFTSLKGMFDDVTALIRDGVAKSAFALTAGGIAEAVCKMSFGNKIGANLYIDAIFNTYCGGILVEVLPTYKGQNVIGETVNTHTITVSDDTFEIDELLENWQKPLETVFATKAKVENVGMETFSYDQSSNFKPSFICPKPTVFIPVFPGTNCEYDSSRAFERAGANVDIQLFRNLTASHIEDSVDLFVKAINNAQMIMLPGGFSAGDEPDGSGKFIATVFRNPKIQEAVMELLYKRDGLMLGVCNGFQALVKLGLLPYGEIREMDANCPTLTYNKIGRHVSQMVDTRICSVKSPWLSGVNVGDVHTIAVSHGEGRFVASSELIASLAKNGQIATQYVDKNGNPTYEMPFNPNGSNFAIEGITSADGRIFGKMGHSERIGKFVSKNIYGEKDQKIFESGVNYFK